MENSTLNKAHQQQRRAEACLRQRRFEECIDCHQKAMDLLEEAANLTLNQRSLESLDLQKKYHQKQIEMVKMTKSQLENAKPEDRTERRRNVQKNRENLDEGNMEAAIYRTMEIHDSFLYYLSKRSHGGSDNESYSTSDNEDKLDGQTSAITGLKLPKDDSTIIEELKLLSKQLRDSVQFLLTQIDDRNRIIEKLKKRILVLEGGEASKSKNNSLKVITDSSGGTSPYIYSPSSSELSPEVQDSSRSTLPPLAPLELPNFDYANLINVQKL